MNEFAFAISTVHFPTLGKCIKAISEVQPHGATENTPLPKGAGRFPKNHQYGRKVSACFLYGRCVLPMLFVWRRPGRGFDTHHTVEMAGRWLAEVSAGVRGTLAQTPCFKVKSAAGASCPYIRRDARGREDMWAAGMRQTGNAEMRIRRAVGYSLAVLAAAVAVALRGGHWLDPAAADDDDGAAAWRLDLDPATGWPAPDTLARSTLLGSLCGGAMMLWAMGQLSQ